MPNFTLTREQVRSVDRRAIDEYGLAGVVLMENAGRGAAEFLVRQRIAGPVAICAGKGNNGGDGFVIARWLDIYGLKTRVLLFCDPRELSGDAATNYAVLQRSGLAGRVLTGIPDRQQLVDEFASAGCLVDALLGTGTRGEIREPYVTAIREMNASGKPVLAVDLPSGLDCDTGRPCGVCIRATWTATFVGRKTGFDSPGAAEWTGTVTVLDIGVLPTLIADIVRGPVSDDIDCQFCNQDSVVP